ncbi:interferon alpha-21-like [Lepisosteus oculatus]|uniref:interferon alpha-21-like n=1 Tax=Lepisosteus oculatus TaxID=7918 RepID=UPI0037211EF2
MALKGFLWLCVVFCLSQAWAMPTRCAFREHLIEVSLNLLKDMGGHFPRECIKDNVLITFPAEVLTDGSQNENIQPVVYETLRSVNTLFQSEGRPSTWDQRKLEDFQSVVFRQVSDFKKCALRNRTRRETSSANNSTVQLKTYFKKMGRFLEEKNYSSCAWEITRQKLIQVIQAILEKQHAVGALNVEHY